MGRSTCGAAGTAFLVLACGLAATAGEVKVAGRVVDAEGKPVAGAEVASSWYAGGDGQMSPYQAAKTDGDGRFTAKVNIYMDRDVEMMAMDAGRKAGGLAVVRAKEPNAALEIRLRPTVRLHARFESKTLGKPLLWLNTMVRPAKGNGVIAQGQSTKAECSFLLPPGDYVVSTYGSDVKQADRPVALEADRPDLDLGTIDLAAHVIAQHRGKAPPDWVAADARNAKKDLKLDDLRGKWVLVDFWGYWCGPCVVGMADMIDFYEEHKAHRDKFEIVAFHDATAKDFDEMDAKLTATKRDLWDGRDLPFPVLLDAPSGEERGGMSIGKTVLAFGIEHYPTSILVDPDGKLVGEINLDILATKLPAVPLAERLPRALNKQVTFQFDTVPLDKGAEALAKLVHLPVRLDADALKAAGVAPDAAVPLTIAGRISLRSAFDLLLAAHGLTVRPDDAGLVVTRVDEGRGEPASVAQKTAAERIVKKFDGAMSFDFQDATLAEVAQYFENETEENFVLDPSCRKAGTIDPKATVTGSAKGVPLRRGLETLLGPLGITAVVRDEVVVLSKAGP